MDINQHGIRTWIKNYIHCKLWDVITYAYPNPDKLLLKRSQEHVLLLSQHLFQLKVTFIVLINFSKYKIVYLLYIMLIFVSLTTVTPVLHGYDPGILTYISTHSDKPFSGTLSKTSESNPHQMCSIVVNWKMKLCSSPLHFSCKGELYDFIFQYNLCCYEWCEGVEPYLSTCEILMKTQCQPHLI